MPTRWTPISVCFYCWMETIGPGAGKRISRRRKSFSQLELGFPSAWAARRQRTTGSIAAPDVVTERGLSAGAPIEKDLGSALGIAHSGALAFEAGFSGRDPTGLGRIRTDVNFRPARPFERIDDFVPARARGACR